MLSSKVDVMAVESDSQSQGWLVLLQSKKRLEREKGLHELQLQVDNGRLGEEERRKSEGPILELLTSLTCSWEAKHGAIMATCILLSNMSEEAVKKLKGEIPLLLEHDESRVRLAAGTCAYCMPTAKNRTLQ